MDDAAAHTAVRLLLIAAAVIVAVRSLALAQGEREHAATAWQHVWLVYLVDYALAWRHPLALATPDWYGAAVRPLGLLCMAAGLAVVVWAYRVLGAYWSGSISVRRDHRVVESGPFAVVRHPVYAGFLLGVCGAALALADPAVALAAAASVPFVRGRALAEERFLEERLGDAYRDYRRRVRMFVPGLF
jgi:protein-S-isoprenylcysteine O-methyltransferase